MIRIHPTADVSPKAVIGEGTSIWHQCQVREGAQIGEQDPGQNAHAGSPDVPIGKLRRSRNNCSVTVAAVPEDFMPSWPWRRHH
jgi:acyl-[acyl carrier protein]--UDP-N-acetylglucosamine O-acyltransferase